MSSPRDFRAEPVNDYEGNDSEAEDLNFRETLPSSSQENTPRSKVFENKVNSEKVKLSLRNFPHNDYEDVFEEPSESGSDPSMWTARGPFRRDRWSSEDEEAAGPSQALSPLLSDTRKIVSEGELDQLAQIRPLIFNFHEQTAIKDCLKILEEKTAAYDIMQEFMALELKNLPGEFNSGNQPSNREKNRYRDILPLKAAMPPPSEEIDATLPEETFITSPEFVALQDIADSSQDSQPPSFIASRPITRLKSQQALKDDSTRVPLGKSKDYINASYIRIVNCGEEYFYIATQGPLLSTIDDFWQMVLENNSNVIAMITREIEGGIIKCYHYWPISLKKPLELKHFRVFLENYQILQYFIIRMFQVVEKSTGTSHSVKQLQFTKWPDHGTPASADSFIKYIRYARKSHLTGPMVVHCSAGIGRTGVFLCVDVVFCAIVKNCSFNIMDIVAQMREQRSGMVQTKVNAKVKTFD
ncbi:tyrosine-protein phosphatase non-receptor type 20 isoform X31 [Homo sapiens]|uniref:tyrosine-protein phosphatase non-receptor type 20 isoform X31 n=1 Tax=Homo sapiens TaxID=9606 RepID=UPI0023DF3462|nr:tyrosine-protein phosphatase non-receptor type 20 isoform X31 [Homo sapiens]